MGGGVLQRGNQTSTAGLEYLFLKSNIECRDMSMTSQKLLILFMGKQMFVLYTHMGDSEIFQFHKEAHDPQLV